MKAYHVDDLIIECSKTLKLNSAGWQKKIITNISCMKCSG